MSYTCQWKARRQRVRCKLILNNVAHVLEWYSNQYLKINFLTLSCVPVNIIKWNCWEFNVVYVCRNISISWSDMFSLMSCTWNALSLKLQQSKLLLCLESSISTPPSLVSLLIQENQEDDGQKPRWRRTKCPTKFFKYDNPLINGDGRAITPFYFIESVEVNQ